MNQASPLPNPGIGGQTGRVHPLIEVPALDRLLRRQTPVILLDVRWHLAGPPGIESYRRGHLPGAVFVDLDRDVAGPPGPGGRHPLPEPVVFESAMRRAGVSQDSLVVVYDDADSMSAARAWWSLRYFGHERVRVLDGGYRAWTEAGHRVDTAEPEVKPGDFIANPGRLPVLDAEGAAELARAGVLLDARAAERYRGDQEPVDPVAGHIPGARNAPTSGNVGVDGRFLPPELLRERFAQLGATDALDVGAYCGSGVTAAHEILALNLAGIPAALYVGSWSNWVTDPSNPIATGDT
ncbi:sulfurtransferase [Actinomadura bangladeshensis]|uniref:Sulfurtransferase n=1 Tax=Actinomadura bangladeshensis TaxID=453573 RepID=A0A6L9QE68_9ACTN|nr:sulfurtransferase [Actinomadura bangladeshensis]NEA23296.1 sulfurtransferase [Actinomadura bangladeshensis]